MHPEKRLDPDQTPGALEARLRALPQPPIPAELEVRLLAAIPARLTSVRRRWPVWVGALAAACLMAVLAWQGLRSKDPGPTDPSPAIIIQAPSDSDRVASWPIARRFADEPETPTFQWPLPETPPIKGPPSIPADLFN